MRVAMIGAGAMGVIFGARFAAAGAAVWLYDHNRVQIDAIRRSGLRVESAVWPLHLALPATTALADLPPVDLAVVLVDSTATAAVAADLARHLPPETSVLTLQNGLGNIEALAAALGAKRVLAGSTYNSGAWLEPGRVLHSNIGDTVIGELDGRTSDRLRAIATLFERADLPVASSDAIIGVVWLKGVLNAAINPVSALTGLRPGEVMRTPPARALLERLLDECLAVVSASGIALPVPDARAYVLDHAWERYNRPSMLQHLEQGRRTEIDALLGAVLAAARPHHLACPVTETVLLMVKARELRPPAGTEIDEATLEAAARAAPRPS